MGTLLLAIVVMQIVGGASPAGRERPTTVLLPLRPSLMREAEALTIADEASAPLESDADGHGLFQDARLSPQQWADAIRRLDGSAALALRPDQRRKLAQLVRRLESQTRAATGTDPRVASARVFRTLFMRVTLEVLAALRPEQVAFIAEHNEDLYVDFEASYWQTLRDRLGEPASASAGRAGGAAAGPALGEDASAAGRRSLP